MDERGIKDEEEQGLIERIGEKILWSTRYVVLIGVISSVLASIALFLVGSFEIYTKIMKYFPLLIDGNKDAHSNLLVGIIQGIDLYLIAVVLMIFGFGIYELFISKIDFFRHFEKKRKTFLKLIFLYNFSLSINEINSLLSFVSLFVFVLSFVL